MDSFEAIVGLLLQKEGYWVRRSVKVNLTPKEKKKIRRHSSPRWELDLVAYKAKSNELLVVECKSLLDSRGVTAQGVSGKGRKNLYKLFNDSVLRKTVLNRLVKELVESDSCASFPSVTLCLAAGKIARDADRENIKKLFERNGWRLFDDSWLSKRLKSLGERKSGY